MNSKLQDILHWILVIALTIGGIEPALNQLLTTDHVSAGNLSIAVISILVAAAIKFVYYATTIPNTVQITDIPTTVPTTTTVEISPPTPPASV